MLARFQGVGSTVTSASDSRAAAGPSIPSRPKALPAYTSPASAMASPEPHARQQNVLLPSARFVMVDKGWQRSRKAPPAASPSLTPPSNRTMVTSDLSRRKSGASDASVGRAGQRGSISSSSSSASPASSSSSCSSPPAPAPAAAPAKRNRKQQKGGADTTRKLQFINASEPNFNRDPNVRMLVRSHVMKGVKRDEKLARSSAEKASPSKSPSKSPSTHSPSSQPSPPEQSLAVAPYYPTPLPATSLINGASMSLYGATPIAMRQESHSLLFYYRQVIGNAVYPFPNKLTFNPVQTSWIPCALADDVFFQTLMFSSASHQSFLGGGQKKSLLPPRILGSVFSQLGQRLDCNRNLSDATIGAVTCLAMVENMRGNYHNYKVHMDGLTKILSIRGIADLEEQMQLKVYRTEVEGAINFLTRPLLPPYSRVHRPLEEVMPPELAGALDTTNLAVVLDGCGIDPTLTETLCTIARFGRSLHHVLSSRDMFMVPSSYDEDLICLQLELLVVDVYTESGLTRAARLGGMLFIKSTMRGVGIAPPSSRKLLQNLKDSLLVVRPEQRMAPLMLWLAVIGGVASLGLPEHRWFVERLRLITCNVPTMQTWDDCLRCLRSMIWVDWIHKGPCMSLWEEMRGLDRLVLP